MKICPYCAYHNREGFLYCEECGQALSGKGQDTTLPTRDINLPTGELSARPTWGTARLDRDATLVLHIRDAAEPVTFQPAARVIFGRADNTSSARPDIDLTPYGALEKGVSRIHAAICRNEDTLTLVDMGSANGTYLNGNRLMRDQPRVLRDGDEIRLGRLVAHLYFKN
jgi:pSer/pThr/pTyr-binding forkhead associated (FHA) protein